MRFKLQRKFKIIFALVGALSVMLLLLLLQWQAVVHREVLGIGNSLFHQQPEPTLHQHGELIAQSLAEAVATPLSLGNVDAVNALADRSSHEHGLSYARVYDAHGVQIASASQPLMPTPDGAAGSPLPTADAILSLGLPVMHSGQAIGMVRVGVVVQRAGQTAAVLDSAFSAHLQEFSGRYLSWLMLLWAGMATLALLLAFYAYRRLLLPIRALAVLARRIDGGDYEALSNEPDRNDELGELRHALWQMSRLVARHRREVQRMTFTDSLTGLTNRLAFRESLEYRLETAQLAGRQLALLFADIDDFKRINDTMGHEAGDQALVQFAERINVRVTELGGEDALLARFGGDEFVILVQSDDVAKASENLAELLVSDLSRSISVQGREVFLGGSIGIALYPADARDASSLLKCADIAMYQAKIVGKNCHRFYSRAMDYATERRVQMEYDLRGAWGRGELYLVYQPIYRCSDRRIMGAEVLVRWQHPELGAIAPSTFIEVAEQSGLIDSIGREVLRAACQEAAGWPAVAGESPLFIAVNISSLQLSRADLVDMVADCLAEFGLEAPRLHLELTETAVIGDEIQAASLLERLRRIGVKVWLDDFGTGFSGLSHLRQVPVDGVKIDRSFVADLQRDPDDLVLTKAIITMAHSLGMTVVAEGIEQQVQYELLRESGCELGQGFWLSRPLEAATLRELLAGVIGGGGVRS